MQTTVKVLGLPSFEPDELAKQIDHIDVSGDKQLQYHFQDGRVEVVNWNYESRSTAWTAEKRAATGEKTRRRYENERSKS